MEAETITPEDASATSLPLVESKIGSEEIKFPQKDGSDLNSKYPLAEETRKQDSGKTDEVTETRPQEIYQESSKACLEREIRAEHQPEGYERENKILRQTDSEVMMEKVLKSSEPEDETMLPLPKLAINQVEMAEKSFKTQIETNKEEEPTTTDDDQSCRPQNELEQMNRAVEVIDLTQSVGKDVAENEHIDQNSQATRMENEITKHSNSEAMLTMENSIKSSYNMEELEKTLESYSVDNSDIKDDGKITEEAIDNQESIEVELQKSERESVPEDKALSALPTTTSITVEAVEESIQEFIHKEEESPVTDTEEGHRTASDFQKNTVPEASDHEGISNTCMEGEKKAQNQSEAQSMETMAIMHPNLDGLENTDISLRNSTEEQENHPASPTGKKLEMKDGGNIMPEEEKEMELREEATGVCEDERKEEESPTIENKSSGPENEPEQMTKDIEAMENPKPTAKIDAEMEENADHQSEASSSESVIIKHINIEGKERESSPKSNYEMDEVEKNPEFQSVTNAETKEVGKITPEEAIEIKEYTNMELQKSATESVSADKALQTLHTTASVRVETVQESIKEEVQNEVGSAVTDTKDVHRPENDFEEKTELLEAFVLHEGNSCAENEKADIQPEGQNLESMVIKHLNKTIEEESTAKDNNSNQPEKELEETTDTVEAIDQPKPMVKVIPETKQHANHQSESSCMESLITKHIEAEGKLTTESSTKPCSDVGKQKNIPESQSFKDSEIKDDSKIIPEEATDIKEATSVEIQKFNIESVPEDKTLSTLHTEASVGVQRVEESIQEEIHTEEKIPKDEAWSEFSTSEIVNGETIEEILQQQTVQEEESATTHNHKHSRPVNELEKTANVVEAIDQPETVTKVSVENEEQKDHQSEASSMESLITKHTNTEGKVESESRTKSSYEVDELKKIPKSQLINNSGILKGVPEDEAPQTLSRTAYASVEAIDESIQDKIYMEVESALTDIKEGQMPENDFEMKMPVTEAFGLHEVTCQTRAANELKAEPQSKAQNQDTTFTKHSDFEGETTVTNSTSDIEEHKKVPMSQNTEKLDINDDGKFIEEEAEEMEEATKMKLLKTATESMDNVDELAGINNNEWCRQENELQNMANVEATDQPKMVDKVCEENEEHADCQSEASNKEFVITKYIKAEAKVTMESCTESSYNVDELEKTPEPNLVKSSEIMEGDKIMPEQSTYMKQSNDVELQKSETKESVIEDKGLQNLANTASVHIETVDQSMQEHIHTEVELAVTDTKEGQIPENDSEEKAEIPEAFEMQEVTYQTSVENEIKAEAQSEEQNQETTIIKHLNLEGETTEITPTNDTEEQEKVPRSCSAEKLEIINDGRFIQEEEKEMEEANEMQLLKNASESVSEDKALQTLPTIAYVGAETFDKSIQEEIHTAAEFELTTTKEGQIPESDFKGKMKVPKAFGLHEVTQQTRAENVLKAEPQSKVKNQETTIMKHSNLDGEIIEEINPTNDTEKQEKVSASQTGEILGIKDDWKFIQEEAKETDEATKMQLPKGATESLPEDEIEPTMATAATVKGDTEELLEQQTLHDDKTEPLNNDKICREESELEKTANFVEPLDQSKTTAKVDAENEEQADQQSEESSIQSVNTKHINAERIVASESSTKSSNEADEKEKIVDSHLGEDLESTYGSKITAKDATDTKQLIDVELQKSETAKSVPDDKVLQTLLNTDLVCIEAVDESSQEEIHTAVELAVTNTIEEQIPENDFEDKKIPEAFDLHEVTCKPSAEKELKVELQSEVQNQETTFINHHILEKETIEINPTKDTEEQEKVLASQTIRELHIKEEDGQFIQEEAKQMQATEMQLLKTAMESPPGDDVQSTLLTSTIVEGDIEQILRQQTPQDDDSAAFDNKSCKQENELEKTSNVEAIDQPEIIMIKVSDKNEEHVDHQSEASSMQSSITKDIKVEGIVTLEYGTKSSYDADKPENIVNSQSVQNFECNDGSTTTAEEAIDTKQSTDMEMRKSETESLPEDKALQTLLSTDSVDIEAVGENIQEEHREEKLTVPNTTEAQAFGLHETTHQPNAENELKAETRSKVQNQEITIKHINLEGETTETNPTNNTEELEKVTESHNRDKLQIEDNGKFIQEEAKQSKEDSEMQLVKTRAESQPEEEVQSASLTSAIVKSNTQEILQHETLDEDKSAMIDNDKSGKQENEVEKLAKVDEVNDQLETMDHVGSENEEHAEYQLEASSLQSLITKHFNAAGIATSESSTKSSYDAEKKEKIVETDMIMNFESNSGNKITAKGEIDTTQSTDMEIQKSETDSTPQDKDLQTSPNTAFVSIEANGESIQEEILEEVELVVTDPKEGQALDLHGVTSQPTAENELKAEPQSDVQNQEKTFIKHLKLEGETTEINLTNDTEEQEKVPASQSIEKLDIQEHGKFIQEAKGMEEATETHLLNTATESVPEDKSQQTLPDAASVGNEAVDETSQEDIHSEMGLAVTCNKEGQRLENDFDVEKDIPEAYGIQELTCQCNTKNELKAESLSEAQHQETTFIKHLNSEGESTEINPNNDSKEQGKIPLSHNEEKLGINDDRKFIQEEAEGIEEVTAIQLLETATESLPEDEVSTLPTYAIVQGDKQIFQQQTIHNDESAVIDNDKCCTQENKPERTSTVLEAIDQLKTKANINEVKEEQANHQSEASSMQSVITKYINTDGIVTLERSTRSSYDMEEQEKIVHSDSVENLKSKDRSKATAEEATHMKQVTDEEIQKPETEGVPEDKAGQTLPDAASVGKEAVDETSEEEMHTEAELAVTCTREGQMSENDSDAKKDIAETYGLYKVAHQLSAEKELRAESQFEVQNQETTFIKHLNSDVETMEINPTNDTEELKKVPMPHTEEKLGIKDDETFIQEEVKGIKEATEVHATEVHSTESLPKDEVQSTLPNSAVVQCEQILQQQTLYANESEAIDNDKSCTQEMEQEKASNVEAIDQIETMANVGAVKEEKADHQSEASSMPSLITKYINAEGTVTSENSTKSSYEAYEQEKIVDSPFIENLESKGGSKSLEARYSKQLTDVEIQKSEIESVPEDQVRQTLHHTASVNKEAVDESSQEEKHIEAESTAKYTKEEQIPENDFVAKKDIPEAFGLQEVTCQLSMENELKDEPQSEAKNQETTFIPNSDGQKTEINPTNDTEEQDKFPASHTGENLGIKDDGKFMQEEAKGMDEATELLSLNPATESLHADEVLSKLPTSEVVNGGTDEILQQQTFQEDESAAIDNDKSFRQESELEKTSNVDEAIDKLETMDKVGEEDGEHADHQSEASSIQGMIAKHISAKGIVTSESSIKSSYDKDKLEKIVDLQSVKNLESKEGCKITAEVATDMRQLTNVEIQISEIESVSEDKSMQTLPTTSVGIEEVEKSIQEIHTEAELAVIVTNDVQISENDFKPKKKVSEYMLKQAFDLHEETYQTSVENEQKAELVSEQQSQETTVIKHLNLDAEKTTKMNPTNDTEEHERIPASHAVEKSEINDDGNFIQEEAREMEEPTEKQLLKTATESVPKDDSQSTLPRSTIVKGDKFERIFQEQTLKKEESAAIDNTRCRPENELEQTAKVIKIIDQHKTIVKVSAENEEHAVHQSEQSSMDKVSTEHINSKGMVTTEHSTKSSYDVEEQERVLEPNSINNSENKNGGEIILEEATDIKEVIDMELQKCEIESVTEDKAISTLSTISCVRVEMVEGSIQEEIQKEAESTVTDTNKEQRPENDFVENMRVLEAFDLHKATSNTSTENEKNAEAQSEAQSHETMIIKHPNLEELETAEISPSNTEELEKEHKIAKPGGVCESISADTTKECSTEDIPKLKDLSMLSDQNTNNSISDMSKICAHDYCKLHSEKEEKVFIAGSRCTVTNTHRNSGDTEGQENTQTDFDDSLTCLATERGTTELETQDSSDKHETTNNTLAEKTVQAADANEKLELAPGSLAKVESDRKNCFDTAMSTVDITSIDNENDENVRNNLELDSIVAQEVPAKLDPDGQRNIQESTEMAKSELPVEKILEPPYPSKKRGSYFDSKAQNQTNEQPYQTKEESTNITEQISEFNDHTQGEKFQSENQTKTEPQMEGEHSSSIPLHPKPTSVASLITKEVHGKVDRADESENIEKQTVDSEKSLSEVQILLPREDTVNQVKHHNEQNLKATDSDEHRVITESSFENELVGKEAESRDLEEAIEEQAATIGKLEAQEAETTQLGSAKEDEFEKISLLSSGTIISRDSQDANVKASHKKSHGILSGVGSKVKHSISKVKKAITGKSSHPKTPPPK